MYDCIMVPLDGSEAAEEALPHAREITRRFGSRVVLVRVVTPVLVAPIPTFAGPELSARERPGDTEAAMAYLHEQAQVLSDAGTTVETVIRHGTPAEELLRCIQDYRPNLVVMTTHGRTGITHLFCGRTTQSVLARSNVPVLVIRPAPADGQEAPDGGSAGG